MNRMQVEVEIYVGDTDLLTIKLQLAGFLVEGYVIAACVAVPRKPGEAPLLIYTLTKTTLTNTLDEVGKARYADMLRG